MFLVTRLLVYTTGEARTKAGFRFFGYFFCFCLMACTLLRGQILIGIKNTLVGVENTLVGVKHTLSSGQILLGVRNTLVGGLKYFSGVKF